MPIRDFRGKTAVVTGAASGIGLALVNALVERACHVALVDVDPAIEALAREMSNRGVRATAHVCDVSNRQSMLALPDAILDAHDAVHLLINNAGVSVAGRFEQVPLEDLDWLFGINFFGVAHGCRAFLPHLRKQSEAQVVNVCSSFAWLGVAGKTAYSASKAAVRAFSEALRAELDDSHVGVTLLFPGPVATNIVRRGRSRRPDEQNEAEEKFLFSRAVPVETVAKRCLAGVQRNASRVVVSVDYHCIDGAVRLSPSLALAMATRASKKMPF